MVIREPRTCIPSCPRPPPTREEMEDWVKVSKVNKVVYRFLGTLNISKSEDSLRMAAKFHEYVVV